MKRILFVSIITILSALAVKSEKVYIGGSLGLNYQSVYEHGDDDFSYWRLNLLPEVGYNLNDTWAIGTTIGLDYMYICHEDTYMYAFDISPYVRYSYYRTGNNLVQLFLDGCIGLELGCVDYYDDSYLFTFHDSEFISTWEVGLKPGVAFNFSDHFSLVAHLGFLGYKGANNNAFELNQPRKGGLFLDGNNISLGFYYRF